MEVKSTIQAFDRFVNENGETFEATVIGAAALVLLDFVIRQTIDVDCLAPTIPDSILKLAKEFRESRPELNLIPNWLNNGPESLLRELPSDWKQNTVLLYEGAAIRFHTLGRADLLKTKLFAFCDRGDDLKDCIAMKPSVAELDDAIEWVKERDMNPMWPDHVQTRFDLLKKRLGYV